MLALLRRDLYPSWALGPIYADLEAVGKDATAPARLCWQADDAILLAPWRPDDDHWAGFLIIEASAAGQRRQFVSETGEMVWLVVPADLGACGAVMAVAGQRLPIAAAPSALC